MFCFSSCEFLRFIAVIQAIKMPKSSQKTNKSSGKGKTDSFVWSDDEVELLLKVTHEYKVSQASENIDWETCQTKYSDICEIDGRVHWTLKLTSSYLKTSVFDRPHEYDKSPFLKIYSLESVFENLRICCRIRRFRVDGSRIRRKISPFLKISGYVWTGP